LDYDEKLEDAITDEVRFVKATGTYDFGTAKFILNPKSGTDSSLTRIEHHWVSPMSNRCRTCWIPSFPIIVIGQWMASGKMIS
jgi:hypothetical protein